MKKFIKNNLFGFILGIMLCSGIVYGTNIYESNTIEYNPTDASWEVNNVNDALNVLYDKLAISNAKFIGFGHRYSQNGKSVPIGYIYEFENSNYIPATFYDGRYYYIENDYIKYVSLYEGTVYSIDHSLTIKKSGYYDILYVFNGKVKMAVNNEYISSGTVYDLDDSHLQITIIVVGY